VQARDDGMLAVFGIVFKVGAENAFLKSIGWNEPPADGQSVKIAGAVNPYEAFKDVLSGEYYHYDGSLTTPPLSEVVTWFVFATPVEMSQAQLDAFKKLYPDPANNRPCQPYNGRKAYLSSYKLPAAKWDYSDNCKPWEALCYNGPTTGKVQSPIDVDTKSLEKEAKMEPFGKVTPNGPGGCELINTGHNLQVNGDFGGFGDFKAVQFHFHCPAEHKIDGVHYSSEMHIVQAREDGMLAVFGIMFKVGAENAFLKSIGWNEPPAKGQTVKIAGAVNPYEAFKDVLSGEYYHYQGSLTTPPLSEVVTWFVFATPVEMSQAQLDAFKKLYPDPANNRPCQPYNGRKAYLSSYKIPAVSM